MITNGLEKGLFGKKNVSDSDVDERVNKLILVGFFCVLVYSYTFIKVHLKALLDKFIYVIDHGAFTKQFLDFIGTCSPDSPELIIILLVSNSENRCTPPNNFLFDFEIKRLQFSHFGTLKYQY